MTKQERLEKIKDTLFHKMSHSNILWLISELEKARKALKYIVDACDESRFYGMRETAYIYGMRETAYKALKD